MVAPAGQQPSRPLALQEASSNSTSVWQDDLCALFKKSKERFADVVWDVVDEDAAIDENADVEVWGHKAIVYARAPPTFQSRFFSFRPAPVASPIPFSTSPTPSLPAQSSLSLSLGIDYPASFRSASPFRSSSPAPSSITGTLLRLPISHNPSLFTNELEYLYTGKGLGEAFNFLFDASERRDEEDTEEGRVDKLRKDLVYMWRSRLYSDVRIELTGPISSTGDEETTAVFSSHRFLLASRSPYFFDQLITYGPPRTFSADPITVKLPSMPFTPPSLHFTLGFMYTGTLSFSNRTYDLDTAFHILKSATYLQLNSLYDEIQARIVQEMMHGLFHAFLEFAEYERITGGKWGTGGCRCRQCARRAPRVLEFAVQPDVQNKYLENGARRALVGLFGEGWINPEFATLPQKTKDGLLKGLAKRTVPMNVFALLYAAQSAMSRLNAVMDAWADSTREMVLSARKVIDETLCNQVDTCFEQAEWLDLMEGDGSRFEDGERVEWVMDSVRRGLAQKNAGLVYQTLVSSILLRPHPTEAGETLLSSTSHVRIQAEQARVDVIRWLRHRWLGVRQEGGFDGLEGWALKEISYEIDVPIEELSVPHSGTPARGTHGRTGPRASLHKGEESDTTSIRSFRPSVVQKTVTRGDRVVSSSGASVRSVARSTVSTASRASTASVATFRSKATLTDRGSKAEGRLHNNAASASTSSLHQTAIMMDVDEPPEPERPLSEAVGHDTASVASSKRTGVGPRAPRAAAVSMTRPKSSAPSVSSVRSKASTSTARKSSAGESLRPKQPSPASRPTSSASLSARSEASTASTTFKTARESVARSRRLSTASTQSTVSTRSALSPRPSAPPLPSPSPRRRRPSDASSVASSVATSKAKKTAAPSSQSDKPTLSVRKTPSSTSMRSTTSTTSKRTPVKKPAPPPEKLPKRSPNRPLPKVPSKENIPPDLPENTSSTITVKGDPRTGTLLKVEEGSTSSGKSDGGTSSRGTVRRKESNDTITVASVPTVKPPSPVPSVPPLPKELDSSQPKGATLNIGIPCIISSKRKRFRALARYIGEVEGEHGPWVGVEVPVGDEWVEETVDGRQWNDGTWGGVRYFDVGASSEWAEDERMNRRRRNGTDWVNGLKGSKREGDQLSIERKKRFRSASPSVSELSNAEYRGLFVRPQQVLYVIEAVGVDNF